MPLPPYGSLTSAEGAAISTIGFQLLVGSAACPETMYEILNATDFKLPSKAELVDVTNFGDLWRRRIPTLLDMGTITFKVFWVMTEPSHHNGADGTAFGLRYILVNRLLRDWQAVYPDNANGGSGSIDAFPAYVTNFEVSGSQGKFFEASIELANSGQPSIC